MPLSYLKKQWKARKKRWTPTGDKFAFADSIEFLNLDHWAAATAASGPLFSVNYLRCLEAHGPRQLSFKYGLIYREGSPIAALVMQILDTDLSAFVPQGSKRAVGGKLVKARLFLCGSLLCWGNCGVAMAPEVEPATVWPSVAEALFRVRRAERITGETDFVLVRDLPLDCPNSAVLADYSYTPVKVEPDMVLELKDWTCFDDYLASLSSKYRKAAKNIQKTLDKSGCVVEDLQQPAMHEERLHQLYREVWKEAEVRPVEFSPGYLPALKDALGDDFAFIAIKRQDQILGFVTLIRQGELSIGYILGFDREAARDLPLYLRLLQAVTERSLQWGCKRISFGGTALEPKARLGAQAQPRQVWARHRLAPLNALVAPMLASFSPQQPPDRNPFKS